MALIRKDIFHHKPFAVVLYECHAWHRVKVGLQRYLLQMFTSGDLETVQIGEESIFRLHIRFDSHGNFFVVKLCADVDVVTDVYA